MNKEIKTAKLIAMMRYAKITQEKAAEIIGGGMTQSNFSQYLTRCTLPDEYIDKIAEYAGFDYEITFQSKTDAKVKF